jgi:hypothetical protein
MKFRGYGYTFYVAKQTHLKGQPKTCFIGCNVDGVGIFKTSDKVCHFSNARQMRLSRVMWPQSCHETYRFAKLKSWAATSSECTFKVSKDEGKHTLKKEAVVFSTEMVIDTFCGGCSS